MMPVKSPFNCLWWLQKKYIRAVSVKRLNIERWHIKYVINFEQRFLFPHSSNHRSNSSTQISAATWRNVHENILAGAFHSKKNSALLSYELQAWQKWCLSSGYLTACGDWKKNICNIFTYFFDIFKYCKATTSVES